MRWRVTAVVMASAALMVLAAACGGDDDSSSDTTGGEDTAAGEGVVIAVSDFTFPEETSVPAGQSVTWDNQSGARHVVVFDTVDGEPADLAELDLPNGEQATASPGPGTWEYHCSLHPSMIGTLVVEG